MLPTCFASAVSHSAGPPVPPLPRLQAGHTKRERRKPYKHLRTPWGESFEFKAESRESIARATLDRIHRLNALDEELWKEGDRILTVRAPAAPARGRAAEMGRVVHGVQGAAWAQHSHPSCPLPTSLLPAGEAGGAARGRAASGLPAPTIPPPVAARRRAAAAAQPGRAATGSRGAGAGAAAAVPAAPAAAAAAAAGGHSACPGRAAGERRAVTLACLSVKL